MTGSLLTAQIPIELAAYLCHTLPCSVRSIAGLRLSLCWVQGCRYEVTPRIHHASAQTVRLLFGYTRKFSSGKCLWNWPCHAFNFCLCHDPSDLHTLKRFYYRAVPSMPNQLFGDIDKTLLLSLHCDKRLFSRRGLTELECGGGSATLPNGPCQAREGV